MSKNAARLKYQRKRRAEARAKGMCAVCCTRKPDPPYSNCFSCRQGTSRGIPPTKPFCLKCLAFHKVCPTPAVHWRRAV